MDINQIENQLKEQFARIDDIAFCNQKKVLNAFHSCKIQTSHFAGTTGYGYDDTGRDTLARLFATIFKGEKAIVSPLISCGSHAISNVLYGLTRPNDNILSISGNLYDTLNDTLFGQDNGSLQDYGISFEQVELAGDDFDEKIILKKIEKLQPKIIFIQRSRGYTSRKALSIEQMEKICKTIRANYEKGFIVVDNCYGEFVEKKEPLEIGADVVVGSLIKNAGGGLAPTGGYIVGSEEAINRIASRHTCPSLQLEVGSYEMGYRLFYQGIFMAPHTVKEALKGAYLVGKIFENKNYKVLPSSQENAYDIIKSIVFNTEDELVSFVQTIQKFSPIDSFVLPLPWEMPGYDDKVIMAAGTFVSGASIELSCDSPIKKPYIAYFQGGLSYEHIKCLAESLL